MMPPPPHDTSQDAATSAFNRSPILIKAVSERYPPSRTSTFLAWLLALVIPSLFYIGPAMLLLPPILYYMASWKAALASLLLNVTLATFPNKRWPWFRSVFELWFDCFDFHHNLVVKKENPNMAALTKEESNALLICAMHPHGVIPIQAFLWMAFCNLFLEKSYGFGAAANVVLRIPLLRQVLSWGSAGSASYSTLYNGLSRGENLFILAGGVAEIFSSKRNTHSIYAQRRGLMKLSLQTGASLVPVYVFGGNDFYHQVGLERISRKSQAAFTLFWGQYGLPIPYPTRCSMVLGDPIVPCGNIGEEVTGSKTTAQKVPNPTQVQIEELLQRYNTALHGLFHQYKAQAGYPNADLQIR